MALDFESWTTREEDEVNGHCLTVMTAADGAIEAVSKILAEIVTAHYAAPKRLADLIERLGMTKAADFLRTKLPTNKRIRSGDLGEILATEFIDSATPYQVPVKRLRWKDHRNMAMRGDDVIGIIPAEGGNEISFLKTESKSRAAFNTATVEQARRALSEKGGLPSPHALAFVADRLHEIGNEHLADMIDSAQLNSSITVGQVDHMLFAFSGNSPKTFLTTDLTDYEGANLQWSVGLRVPDHQKFIAAVYGILADTDDS